MDQKAEPWVACRVPSLHTQPSHPGGFRLAHIVRLYGNAVVSSPVRYAVLLCVLTSCVAGEAPPFDPFDVAEGAPLGEGEPARASPAHHAFLAWAVEQTTRAAPKSVHDTHILSAGQHLGRAPVFVTPAPTFNFAVKGSFDETGRLRAFGALVSPPFIANYFEDPFAMQGLLIQEIAHLSDYENHGSKSSCIDVLTFGESRGHYCQALFFRDADGDSTDPRVETMRNALSGVKIVKRDGCPVPEGKDWNRYLSDYLMLDVELYREMNLFRRGEARDAIERGDYHLPYERLLAWGTSGNVRDAEDALADLPSLSFEDRVRHLSVVNAYIGAAHATHRELQALAKDHPPTGAPAQAQQQTFNEWVDTLKRINALGLSVLAQDEKLNRGSLLTTPERTAAGNERRRAFRAWVDAHGGEALDLSSIVD